VKLFLQGFSLCVLCTFLSATPVLSQNLLVNPNFNTDIGGWGDNGGVGSFDGTMDANGSLSSGSAKGTFAFSAPASMFAVYQCVSGITPGQAYDFGGRIRIQSGPPGNSGAWISVVFHSGNTCSSPISSFSTPFVTTAGSWEPANATMTAPGSTGSIFVVVFFANGAVPGTMVINVDDMFLQGSPQGATIPALSESILIALALILGGLGVLLLRPTS
jgi:hypothetical protein